MPCCGLTGAFSQSPQGWASKQHKNHQKQSYTLGLVHNYYYNDLQKHFLQATVLNYCTDLGGGGGPWSRVMETSFVGDLGEEPPHPLGLTPDKVACPQRFPVQGAGVKEVGAEVRKCFERGA